MRKITAPKFSEICAPARFEDLDQEYRFDDLSFRDQECAEDLHGKSFFECTFRNVHFTGRTDSMEFADVIFDHCNLSNLSFAETAFRRVQFIHCRMTGADLSRCGLQDTEIRDSRCDYAGFSASGFRRSLFRDSDLSDGTFSSADLSGLALDHDRLMRCEFLHASMKGLDLSSCEIDGMLVDPASLRGVIVSAEQAVGLASLLGIIVKH